MAEPVLVAERTTRWGPAERAAIDRCLSLPSLAPDITNPNLVPDIARARPTRLSRVIEAEIIPRLMLAHRPERRAIAGEGRVQPQPGDAAELAGLATRSDAAAALDYLNLLLGRGYSLEDILLGVLAPAARLLGDMWTEDLCSFADVTIGLSRLQQILHSLGGGPEDLAERSFGGRMLLAATPGEQHSLGVTIVEGFFRRAGWDVCRGSSQQELREMVRDEWFDVVGLSLSCDILLERLGPVIQALRKVSRNKSLFVIVGGRFFSDNPDRAAEVGADAVASDAQDALRLAQVRLSPALTRC